MDRKAEKAQQHRLSSQLCLKIMVIMKYNFTNDDSQHNENVVSEELRRGREDAVRRIEGYHRHIDNCTAEMRKLLGLFPFIRNVLFIQVFLWILYVAMNSPTYFQESMREKLMNVERESKGSKT